MPRSRIPALLFIVAYLAAVGWFLFKHIQGDPGHSPLGYFWTWDMYPDYSSWSRSRSVVGRTSDGRYVQLVPGPTDRFRWGVQNDATRLDLSPNPRHHHAAAARAVARYRQSGAASLQRVFVIERYQPVRFHLSDERYQAAYGEPNPRREYFRVLDEATMNEDGTLQWSGPE